MHNSGNRITKECTNNFQKYMHYGKFQCKTLKSLLQRDVFLPESHRLGVLVKVKRYPAATVLLAQAVAHNRDGLHRQLVVTELTLHADNAPGSTGVRDLSRNAYDRNYKSGLRRHNALLHDNMHIPRCP